MNHVVVLKEYGVNEILDIVKELSKQHKLVINVDFEFHYNPPQFDFMNTNLAIPRHTLFKFKDPKYVTYLTLKYGN